MATKQSFSARPTAPVAFEIDRVAHVGTGAARRTAVLISDATRQNYVMMSENDNEGGWEYNRSGDSVRGGTLISAFANAKYNDLGNHRIKLLANGTTVKLYLDDVFGAEVPFPISQGIVFEFGTYARSYPDSILGTFDNAQVTGPIPNITAAPTNLVLEAGQANPVVTITIPAQIHQTNTAKVIVTSSNPGVAIPAGAVNGAITLTFGPGGPDQQTFEVVRVTKGLAVLSLANDQGAVATDTVTIQSLAAPTVLLSDNFESGLQTSRWQTQAIPFEPAWPSAADTSVTVVSGALELSVTPTADYWPGVVAATVTNFQTSLIDPVTFEVDRVITYGAGSGTRSGVFIYDASGTNSILFADLSESSIGWCYNRSIGQAGDNPGGAGTAIAAFSDATYKDFGLHRIKLVANGATVKLYVDGVFGVELPFPFAKDLRFAIFAGARAVGDYIITDFDNVKISGTAGPLTGGRLQAVRQNEDIQISWTGVGTLQWTDTLPGSWNDLPNATNPLVVKPADQAKQKFYRLH